MPEPQSWLSFEDIVSEAAVQIKDSGRTAVAPESLANWASDGNQEFASLSETVRRHFAGRLEAGVSEYLLPTDCIKPTRVFILWPGDTDERVLDHHSPKRFERPIPPTQDQGIPTAWYLKEDRKYIGVWPTPDTGGIFAKTTSGAGGATTIISTALSATDDIYNGMRVRLMSGAMQGQESIVTDYDAATTTLTVSPAFTGNVASGVYFEINFDSLLVDYCSTGRRYAIRPTPGTLDAGGTLFERWSFDTNLTLRPPDWYNGAQVEFTTGNLAGIKTLIVGHVGQGTLSRLSVWPWLPLAPASGDLIKVTDVPDIPHRFHKGLVDYVIAQAIKSLPEGKRRDARADMRMREFHAAADRARAAHRQRQSAMGEVIPSTRIGDDFGV